MTGYIHDGHILTVPAPHEVEAGQGLRIGALFGISRTWAAAGEPVELFTWGVFDLQKPEREDWRIGDRIYWNEADRGYSKHAIGRFWIGYSVSNALALQAAVGRVKLVGTAT